MNAIFTIAVLIIFVFNGYSQSTNLAAEPTTPASTAAPQPASPPPADPKNSPLDGLLYFSTTNGLSIRLDPKTIANSGAIGLDYEVKYERPLDPDQGIAKSRFDLEIMSSGFIATKKEDSQNSLISELRFAGQLFLAGTHALPPLQQARVRDILESYDDPFAMPPAVAREYDDLMHSERVRYARFDAHVKHETDQSFHDYQIAGGVGLSSDLGLITGNDWPAKVFDFPFAMTRSAQVASYFKPRLPRFYFGYDYVDATHNKARSAITSDDSMNRLTLQAAWSTLCFDFVEVRASVQAYYEVDANQAIRAAGKQWTAFSELSAGIPIDSHKRKKIFVKYDFGELPPTLKQSSNVAIGFSIEMGQLN
jgi:hypothetical protein